MPSWADCCWLAVSEGRGFPLYKCDSSEGNGTLAVRTQGITQSHTAQLTSYKRFIFWKKKKQKSGCLCLCEKQGKLSRRQAYIGFFFGGGLFQGGYFHGMNWWDFKSWACGKHRNCGISNSAVGGLGAHGLLGFGQFSKPELGLDLLHPTLAPGKDRIPLWEKLSHPTIAGLVMRGAIRQKTVGSLEKQKNLQKGTQPSWFLGFSQLRQTPLRFLVLPK